MADLSKKKVIVIKNQATVPVKYTRFTLDSTALNNLIISSVAATSLPWLQYKEDSQGNRFPTTIFKGQASSFHAFVLLVMFGFSASFSALFCYERPKVASIFRSCSVIFVAAAAAVFIYAFCSSGSGPLASAQ